MPKSKSPTFFYPLCKFSKKSRSKMMRTKKVKMSRKARCHYSGKVPRCVKSPRFHATCSKKGGKKRSRR